MKTSVLSKTAKPAGESKARVTANPLQLLQGGNQNGDKQPVFNPLQLLSVYSAKTAIQLKRTPSEIDMAAYLRSGRRGDKAENTDTADTVNENYQKSFTSGEGLMNKGVKWFTGQEDAVKPVSNQATSNKVATAGYKDFWFPKGGAGNIVVCTHRGSSVDELESGQVTGYNISDDFDDDQSFLYSNTFNVLTGEFHASINYREADVELAKEENLSEALPNSEIIWHQHLVATAAAELLRVDGEKKSIQQITRNQIGNTQTLDTIFMCDGGAEAQAEEKIKLEHPNEDAHALLGTPNGNSALWIIMQHGRSVGLSDIAAVRYSQDWLEITYM